MMATKDLIGSIYTTPITASSHSCEGHTRATPWPLLSTQRQSCAMIIGWEFPNPAFIMSSSTPMQKHMGAATWETSAAFKRRMFHGWAADIPSLFICHRWRPWRLGWRDNLDLYFAVADSKGQFGGTTR